MKDHYVKIRRMNWDSEFYNDIAIGKGFIISDPPTQPSVLFDKGEKRKKSPFGPQSEMYGTTYGDDRAFAERYSCDCGSFNSKQFEGETCPYCHTKVKERGIDIEMTGWLSLGSNERCGKINRIVTPYYYNLLVKLLGKRVFPDIVNPVYRIDTDGHKVKLTDEDNIAPPSSPFGGIGIDEFYDRFEEIMEYFINQNKTRPKKRKSLERVLNEKGNVFSSHVPIYSTMLRPQSVTAETFYYTGIDKLINVACQTSIKMKTCTEVERDNYYVRLQDKVNKMWDDTFNLLNGKGGYIRDQILGGSLGILG